MTLANRLVLDSGDYELMVVQRVNMDLPARPFEAALASLGDVLFRSTSTSEGIVLLTPTAFENGVGIHFMAIAKTRDRARALSEEAFVRLIEVS